MPSDQDPRRYAAALLASAFDGNSLQFVSNGHPRARALDVNIQAAVFIGLVVLPVILIADTDAGLAAALLATATAAARSSYLRIRQISLF